MRLFLSSYRAGNHPDRLTELFGKGTKVGVITNAKDYKIPKGREAKVKENFDYMGKIGLKPEEIDLRKYFDGQGDIKHDIRKYTAFWMQGGNVFLFLRALRQSGLEPILADLVRKNEVVLGGESAGAIIMGPTLKYSEVDTDEDSPNYIAQGYNKDVIWEGLDFINYVPVPHYQTPGYIGIDDYIKNLYKEKIPYKKMTDDQAISINGDKDEFLA
jgi:dipeptidase E